MIRNLFVLLALLAVAADWTYWRGPEQNGVCRETNLPDKVSLKKDDPNFRFAVPYSGLSTPVILKGRVFLIGRTGEGVTQQECVQAFDAETGKLLWEHKFNVWHTDIVDDRLGFTNMVGDVETSMVYAHTTSGMLYAYDLDGKIVWQRSLTEEFGRVSGYGGRVTFPVIDEDKIILPMANASWGEQTIGGTRLVALDKRTGQVIWWAEGGYQIKDTFYSSPKVAVVNGIRTIFCGGGDGCIHAFKVRTGEKLWSYKFGDGAVNCAPVVQGNKIWIGHGEENEDNTQGRLICLDGAEVIDGKPKLLWKYDTVKVKFASPVLQDGILYVCDEAGKLFAFDAEKGGEPLWEYSYGKATKGSPIWADGKIYITEVDSRFHILKVDRSGCSPLATVRFRGKGVVPTELHGTVAISQGRIYFTTTNQLVCFGPKEPVKTANEIPASLKEDPPGTEVAHVQIVPADLTLKPGEKLELKAIGYDKHGRKIGPVKVQWELAGMRPPVFPIGMKAPPPTPGAPQPPPLAGELSTKEGETTTLRIAPMPPGQFGRVLAKLGTQTGAARVRVTPPLPYSMDFDKVPEGRTPGGWVNTMGKFAVVKLADGSMVLRKRNDSPSPLLARANAYISGFETRDYTIQADVYSSKVRDTHMGDVGLGAHRYMLILIGNDQELRLNTWDAMDRGRVKVRQPFRFEPNTWYTMKLMATVVEGKGVVKGKVWPRGEAEPEKWTVELEDPIPNESGAPVLYGFANGTISAKEPGPEMYYDNLKITPNAKK
ncbi:MAG: PQQ-binding-like beta-propeller repeat protein [Gemmataceae bacterium]